MFLFVPSGYAAHRGLSVLFVFQIVFIITGAIRAILAEMLAPFALRRNSCVCMRLQAPA